MKQSSMHYCATQNLPPSLAVNRLTVIRVNFSYEDVQQSMTLIVGTFFIILQTWWNSRCHSREEAIWHGTLLGP